MHPGFLSVISLLKKGDWTSRPVRNLSKFERLKGPVPFFQQAVMLLCVCCTAARGNEKKTRIVCLGDSITRGVRTGVEKRETFAVLMEVTLNERKRSVEVVNVGIGGERTDQALKRLAPSVVSLKPALVLIMYGTNDSYVDPGRKESRLDVAQYRSNLVEIVHQLQKHGITPVLMTPPCWGEKARDGLGTNPNIRLREYAAACRSVANELKVPLVDHFQHWTDAARKGTDIGALTTDQCHPNGKGHRELCDRIVPVVEAVLRSR